MKRLLCVLLLAGIGTTGSSFTAEPEELTKEDRKTIIKYLKESKSGLIDKIRGLSEEQWTYKPSPDTWSAAEICEHIIKAEPAALKRVDGILESEYKPNLVSDYKTRADELVAFIIGRSEKFKAPPHISPEGDYATPADFIEAFEARRNETSEFVKTIKKPIKAYYEVFGPIGEVNGYHWLMFIAAHTERHTIQLTEVLGDPGFPL